MQAAGRSLLGLRCDEASTGFLGKTLLTFVRNKGPAGTATVSGDTNNDSNSKSTSNPLPAHKFSPHDVVAVRTNAAARGGSGGGVEGGEGEVAQGVVYRVYEEKIVVAVDELADSASLDVPLRLDKLANKVRSMHVLFVLGLFVLHLGCCNLHEEIHRRFTLAVAKCGRRILGVVHVTRLQ